MNALFRLCAIFLVLGSTGCLYQDALDAVREHPPLTITDRTVSSRPVVRTTDAKGRAQHRELIIPVPAPTGDAAAALAVRTLFPSTRPTTFRGKQPAPATGSAPTLDFLETPDSILLSYRSPKYRKALPDTRVFMNVMAASTAALRETHYTSPPVTTRDAYEFAGVTLDVLDRAATLGAALDESELAVAEAFWSGSPASGRPAASFDLMATTYLQAYFNGKFVNRRGVKLAKPKIEQNKVDNATLAALETVLIEAYFDFKFRDNDPVLHRLKMEYVPKRLQYFPDPGYIDGYEYVDVPQYETDDNASPTALKFVPDQVLVVPPTTDAGQRDPAPAGVTADEYAVVRIFAGLSAQAKKQLSDLVFRLFGGVELSFVFGGHFSIGNNETLATMITTFIEVSSARVMELKWKRFFYDFRYHHKMENGKVKLFLTDADRTENKNLGIDPGTQDLALLVLRHHRLISQIIGD